MTTDNCQVTYEMTELRNNPYYIRCQICIKKIQIWKLFFYCTAENAESGARNASKLLKFRNGTFITLQNMPQNIWNLEMVSLWHCRKCLSIWSRPAAGKIVETRRPVHVSAKLLSLAQIYKYCRQNYQLEHKHLTTQICVWINWDKRKCSSFCAAKWELQLLTAFPVSPFCFFGRYLVTVMNKVCSTNPSVFNFLC